MNKNKVVLKVSIFDKTCGKWLDTTDLKTIINLTLEPYKGDFEFEVDVKE